MDDLAMQGARSSALVLTLVPQKFWHQHQKDELMNIQDWFNAGSNEFIQAVV